MEDNARIRVDVDAGVVEVEGPEPFVREMLDRYAHVMARPGPRARGGTQKKRKAARKQAAENGGTSPKKKRGKAGRVELDEALRIDLQKQRNALAAYLKERNLKTQIEEAAAIAGFLRSALKRDTINDAEYVTALRIHGTRLPMNPRQVLVDAKNKKSYFHDEDGAFALTTTGLNFVEHDSLKKSDG